MCQGILWLKKEKLVYRGYLVLMFALIIFRYILKISIPSFAFLMVAMLPICVGSISVQIAFIASCIPFSVAFQYKYALLILAVVLLIKNSRRIRSLNTLILICMMMIWELLHLGFGHFSINEFFRDFAELIILGVLISIDIKEIDTKLVIRTLCISVVGICIIMLLMQLRQFNYNLQAVFSRSARSFRFGQSNMESGKYALNFNSNNLGFICNLSFCGSMLLRSRNEHTLVDTFLMICSIVFVIITLSRAAIVCLLLLLCLNVFVNRSLSAKKVTYIIGAFVIVVVALFLIQRFAPTVFYNLFERFTRKDMIGGRRELFSLYNQFTLSSPVYLLFGIGVQGIFEKVSPTVAVWTVPHNGLQEVMVAWGIIGLFAMLVLFWRIMDESNLHRKRRSFFQFAPFVLILVFTMAGQLLTSSRALIGLSFAYVCLCMKPISDEINISTV